MPAGLEAIIASINAEFHASGLNCVFQMTSKRPSSIPFWTHYAKARPTEFKEHKTLVFICTALLPETDRVTVDRLNGVFKAVFSEGVAPHILFECKKLSGKCLRLSLKFSLTHLWMAFDFDQGQLMANLCKLTTSSEVSKLPKRRI